MERAAGFPNQRLVVVPRPLVREALERPITRRLVVTDAGVFPAAEEHGRYRPQGAEETIVITEAAPLLQREDAEISDVIDNTMVLQTPLNGRQFLQSRRQPGPTGL